MISLLRSLFAFYRRRTAFDLATLSRRFAFVPRGVLHVGGNMGQEAGGYHRHGVGRVIWVEGFSEYFDSLKTRLEPYPHQEAHLVLASDQDSEEI